MNRIFPLALCIGVFLGSFMGCNKSSIPRSGPSVSQADLSQAASPDFVPKVRKGFAVERWIDVPDARSLAVSPDGKTVFVGSRSGWVSKIVVAEDGPRLSTFQKGLNGSNGICFVGDDLLLAELERVRRFSAQNGFPDGDEGTVILEGLPPKKHHGWRYIRQGPDGRVRIAIGAPCNVCESKEDPRFATICSFTVDGKEFQIEAKGVRNSVGFDWHPDTGDLYFTDNGRDMLGDDVPPCELNILSSGMAGSHYGFPYRYGVNRPDPEFGDKAPALEFVSPITEFQAHVAPLGCYFPKQESLRKALPGQVIVAQHGSWNRSSPVGYQVVTVDTAKPKAEPEPLLWGFLGEEDRKLGRPVDIAELPDGTILVSDDGASAIWAVRKIRD